MSSRRAGMANCHNLLRARLYFTTGVSSRSVTPMAARIIVRIELTPNAKARLNELTDKAGMTQVAMLSRLVEWFANQSDMIQAAVLGQYPLEIQSEIARLILKRMQGKKD